VKVKNQSVVLKLLSNKPFLYLWIGQILSQVASNMVLFLLGLVVYTTTGSNTAVSGLYLAFGIPAVLFGMVAGAAVDRLDKRDVIIVSGISRAVLVGLLPFVTHNIAVVYIVLFVNAVISQFYTPAEAPLIPKLVSAELLVTANSLFSFAYYSSLAIGFVAAGPLLRLLGPYASFGFLVLCFVVSSWLAAYLPGEAGAAADFKRFLKYDFGVIVRKVVTSIMDGVAYVARSPRLADCLLLLTGTQIIFAMLGTLGPGFADRVMGIDIRDASVVIIGPVIVGVLLGSVWIGNVGYRFRNSVLINTGIISAGAILAVISVTVYLKRFAGWDWLFTNAIIMPLIMTLFLLLGLANSLLDAPANALLQKEAEGEMRGRVYGVLGAAVGGIGILPVIIGGILADAIGVGKVILILGLVITAYGIFRLRYNRGE
jgi:MFS family permease